MTKKSYKWDFHNPAKIDQHSLVKHKIVRAYLSQYIKTLTALPQQDQLKLTLVDGFSGGGIYTHSDTKEIIYGSPLIMLDVVKEADFLINQNRRKKLELNVDYFFIDKEKTACECLKFSLKQKEYEHLIGKTIHISQSDFNLEANKIVSFIHQKSPKRQRAIFLLDQYGYSEVPTDIIRFILHSMSNAEIILTFAVDSFIDYMSDKNDLSNRLLMKTGIPNVLQGRTIKEIQQSSKDWRLLIQSYFHQELVEKCGANYFTPFFIRSDEAHRDYWLVHLSKHHKARDVMTQIHWEENNNFIHYGAAGLDMFMLGYIPRHDNNYMKQEIFDFCFDDIARKKSINQLIEDIPHLIPKDGISFEAFFSTTCNNTPASADIYKEAIKYLIQCKEIEVISKDGTKRQTASGIENTDRIVKDKQDSLFLFL